MLGPILIPKKTVLIGELGLGGQLRPVSQLEQRLREAVRLGYEHAVIPKNSGIDAIKNSILIEINESSYISDALSTVLSSSF